MTENEAIEIIKYRIDTASEIVGKGEDGKSFEDLESAIEALEEIQQYRAIGTVGELVNTQIREKVLNVELESYKEIGTIEEIKEKLSLLGKYEELGTVEELDEVLNMFC